MNKKEKAVALHDKKFNCCQAVACSFAKETDRVLCSCPDFICKGIEAAGKALKL